jgi:hypothetical protein
MFDSYACKSLPMAHVAQLALCESIDLEQFAYGMKIKNYDIKMYINIVLGGLNTSYCKN